MFNFFADTNQQTGKNYSQICYTIKSMDLQYLNPLMLKISCWNYLILKILNKIYQKFISLELHCNIIEYLHRYDVTYKAVNIY